MVWLLPTSRLRHDVLIIAGCFMLAGVTRVLADKPANDSGGNSPAQTAILTGRKANDGTLVLTLTRTPVQIKRGKPFDWQATVEITDGGGMVAINDVYPNEAPLSGYQPKLTINVPANSAKWDAAFEQSYYFKSSDGKIYGRMTVSIQADFQPPPTGFDVEIYANPNSSRNLEFDATKQIGVRGHDVTFDKTASKQLSC